LISGFSVLAVIPARSGSKGLPDKNIRNLAGKPLLGWPVSAAGSSQYIDDIVVSTDSEKYAETARSLGAEVPFLRPQALASDECSTFAVLEHLIANLQKKYDYIVLLEPTSPLTEANDIDKALEQLISHSDDADAIVGIAEEVKSHPAYLLELDRQGRITSLNNDFSSAVRRQDLSTLYRMEGTVYISKTDALLKNKGFYHSRTLGYIVPEWKSHEIDSLIDFICIEAIMQHRELLK